MIFDFRLPFCFLGFTFSVSVMSLQFSVSFFWIKVLGLGFLGSSFALHVSASYVLIAFSEPGLIVDAGLCLDRL